MPHLHAQKDSPSETLSLKERIRGDRCADGFMFRAYSPIHSNSLKVLGKPA